MDLQAYVNNAVKVARQETLAKSDQLTLGELMLKIEPLLSKQTDIIEKYEHEANVVYDFEDLFPSTLDSWRGSYDELALNFKTEGMPMSVTDFYKMLKSAIGQTYVGYKGGDYVMSKHTPIWVANYGNSGHTAVVNVVDNEYEVILITGLRSFIACHKTYVKNYKYVISQLEALQAKAEAQERFLRELLTSSYTFQPDANKTWETVTVREIIDGDRKLELLERALKEK